ncbi:MAG: hypothetical protein F6J87_02440 [Spirulina sp. SIO3F2]|nr:hypothetical protein [Spirulina sp. SIO3F2]
MLNRFQYVSIMLGSSLLLSQPLIAQAQSTPIQAEPDPRIQNLLERFEGYESSPGFISGGRSKLGDTSLTQVEEVNSLLALARRYDCLPNEPDYTFVEGQPVGQYRFAAALAACAEKLHTLAVEAGSIEFIAVEDRVTIQRHVQRFEPELTALGIAPANFAFLDGTVKPGQEDVSFTVEVDIIPISVPFFGNADDLPHTFNSDQDPAIQDLLEQLNSYEAHPRPAWATDVTAYQLPSPTDITELSELVRRYGCLPEASGDDEFWNRIETRYGFVETLSICLQHLNTTTVATGSIAFIAANDLTTLQRYIQEFEPELSALGIASEDFVFLNRDQETEPDRSSLAGKSMSNVEFELVDAFSTDDIDGLPEIPDNEIFGDRVRLEVNTEFNGDDRLVTRLRAGCLSPSELIPSSSEDNTETFVAQFVVSGDAETESLPVLFEDSNSAFDSIINYLGDSVRQSSINE